MKPLTTFTTALDPAQGALLRQVLEEKQYRFREAPHAHFAAEGPRVNVVWYASGKLVVQGRGTQEFVEFVLEPEVLREARLGYEAALNPEYFQPRIGVDESGKGDFFGPLCIAGVYVNRPVVEAWRDLGIQDSKRIGSEQRLRDLAKAIRATEGVVWSVVPVGNEAYNRLYEKMGSVNQILAWGHARVIENLMGQLHRMNPPPEKAISDQFAATAKTVEGALMRLGKSLPLVQRHRAEADLAVAAASILAREEFVSRLARLGKQIGMELPKGASAATEAAARALVEQRGREVLAGVAKMHFRTSYRVLGLPEPPRVVWRRRGGQDPDNSSSIA